MLKLFMSERKCDNILIRGVNWIGDAVMTMPAIHSVKRSRPDAKITLLVKPWVSQLFEKDPDVDEIIIYEDRHKGISGKYRLSRVLRKKNICLAVLLQNAIDAAFITFLAGIPERIGYDRDGRRLLLTKAVPFDDHTGKLHHIEYYLNLVDKAGFRPQDSIPWIYMSIEERTHARDMLKDMRRPVIAINPGATYGSSKRWPPERFASAAGRVISELKGSVVILGGPKETGIADEIYEKIRSSDLLNFSTSQLLNLSSKTSLRELAAVISECDVLLTNDSGPMHVGYAVGTPIVAIFGSTSPELTGPPGQGNIVIKKGLDCSPCFERECKGRHLRCMELITSDEVFDAVRRIIPAERAVFFDRDGTLCRDANYLNRMEDFELFPAIDNLKRLRENGLSLIGITNQSGIARGIVREDFVKEVNRIFIDRYGFSDFYYCPHHPDDHCSCRKPEPGLLHKARKDYGIDLKKSFIVGDKDDDMLLAKAVGATGIFVRTGQGTFSGHADFIADDLNGAVDVILNHMKDYHE